MSKYAFTGVLATWYEQRLRHMYRKRPRCPHLFTFNHLLGLCEKCGEGSYTRSTKFKLHSFPGNRVYRAYQYTVPVLGAALKHFPTLWTNVEYPLPIVQHQTFLHIPAFYDPNSRTVIDYVPGTARGLRLIRAADQLFSGLELNYLVFDGEKVIHRNTFRQAYEAFAKRAGAAFVDLMREASK